jgi:hypothetical protein
VQVGNQMTAIKWNDDERAAVAEEMERIFADPSFKSSRRCQALLRRLIELALAGDHDGVKERTLGIEVFGRNADYDTASDPIVRITANEIRKRLGQWYQEPNRRHMVRIRLVAGSYLPKFDFEALTATPESIEGKQPAEHLELHQENKSQVPHDGGGPLDHSLKPIFWGVALLAVLVVTAVLFKSNIFKSAEFKIWQPLINQTPPLALCISDEDWQADAQAQGSELLDVIAKVIASRVVAPTGKPSIFQAHYPAIDAFLANKITDRIAANGGQTILRRSSDLSFDDFRHQPAVIIGGFNPWSLILLNKLRYSAQVDPVSHQMWIRDAQNPTSRKWVVAATPERVDVDYAIISRFRDSETGQWILSLGGLWPHGTISACSLLTDPEYAYMLPRAFYTDQNAQLVLKTNVIDGTPGPPQVVAVHTW